MSAEYEMVQECSALDGWILLHVSRWIYRCTIVVKEMEKRGAMIPHKILLKDGNIVCKRATCVPILARVGTAPARWGRGRA